MVNTHEVDLTALDFERLCGNDYIIMQSTDIEAEDYILFRQTDANLFMMTQVREIIQNEGLKDGYALLVLSKL